MTIIAAGEKLHDILDILDEGYFECDGTGCLVFANLSFCRIIGSDRDAVIGKKLSELAGGDHSDGIDRIFKEAYHTGVSAADDMNWLSKSGRKVKIRFSLFPISDGAGTVTAFRGIVRDITELDQCEQDLARLRKLEAIGIISGGMAHDYNNALTAILGNITLARMEAGSSNEALVELLTEAEAASFKAVELTKRLSIFARAGRPDRKVIDYSESLRQTVQSVLAGYPGTYVLNIQKGLWKVDVDEFQISHAVTYLLDNAIESMKEPGEISVTSENHIAEGEASHHEITLSPGNYVRISVSDNGTGIKPDDIKNIFDPFFTTKEASSGMGLATSFAIIKRHHGYIDVMSEPGRGSTFFLYLPAILS